ncbi:hypothetical protein ACP26L_32350 [Paenibacillus sp. S-38]|uniref:hypothetical protein n=1 Tax=Paenibacillus sp. S-38 TaxID=3416710 RepID=UPI003CF125B7
MERAASGRSSPHSAAAPADFTPSTASPATVRLPASAAPHSRSSAYGWAPGPQHSSRSCLWLTSLTPMQYRG